MKFSLLPWHYPLSCLQQKCGRTLFGVSVLAGTAYADCAPLFHQPSASGGGSNSGSDSSDSGGGCGGGCGGCGG